MQEYNLKTGKLLRSWDALDHIPLGDSYASVPTNGFPWDAYHVNSIDLFGNERFLVSMRNTWAAYMVNIDTGKIEWTLGGKRSSFNFGPGAAFQWQHDVKLQSDSTVTMFDDHCCQLTGGGTSVPATGPSRGLVLRLDQSTRTRRSRPSTQAAGKFETEYMGDTQPLASGNMFVGWGSEPYFSEYGPSGKLLLEANFPGSDLSYRSTLQQWVGLPLSPPAGAARRTDGSTTVYASWNGATRVASWRVLAGAGAGRLKAVASAARSGFETAIQLPGTAPGATQLRGPGAGRRRPGDRSFPAVHAVGSIAIGVAPAAQQRDATGFQRRMTTRRAAGAVSAALSMAVALAACGGASSSANSAAITAAPDPTADVIAAAANPVTVSPLPGTLDASPSTQISFLGGPGTRVSDVHVAGSRSGSHGGHLQAYSTGTGESFLPSRPFAPGERVTVHALVSGGAGAPAQAASTTFTVTPETPVSQKEFPNNPGNSERRPALPLRAHAHALDRDGSPPPAEATARAPATCSWRPTRARARPGR